MLEFLLSRHYTKTYLMFLVITHDAIDATTGKNRFTNLSKKIQTAWNLSRQVRHVFLTRNVL